MRHDPALAALDVRIRGGDPTLSVDREQIHIVFLNLLLNAAQATDRPAAIDVRITAGDGRCEVAVADRGRGVPPALRDRMFEPFFSTKSRGAGLGLSTARRLIEAHGGSLTARPRDGGGTVLTVTLPMGSPAAQPDSRDGGAPTRA